MVANLERPTKGLGRSSGDPSSGETAVSSILLMVLECGRLELMWLEHD